MSIKIKDQNGFTLVEILISISLIAASALALIKVNEIQTNIQHSLESSVAYNNVLRRITLNMSNKTACTNNLGGHSLKNKINRDLDRIVDIAGNVLYRVSESKAYENDNIKFEKISLNDYEHPGVIAPGSIGVGKVSLVLNLKKMKGYGPNGRSIEKRIDVFIKLNHSMTIIDCESMADTIVHNALKESCLSLGGSVSDFNTCEFEDLKSGEEFKRLACKAMNQEFDPETFKCKGVK